MSSLGDSLKIKAAGTKAPAVTGQAPLKTPDAPLGSGGASGGISASKAKKNAGSTAIGNPASPARNDFISRLGVNTGKNKTNEYF